MTLGRSFCHFSVSSIAFFTILSSEWAEFENIQAERCKSPGRRCLAGGFLPETKETNFLMGQTIKLCVIDKIQGLEIRNGTNGIFIVYDSRGRPTGEAFIQFCSSEDTDLAMKKNREKIGSR